MYVSSNKKTPYGNSAAIVNTDNLLYQYSAKTYVVDRANGKIYMIFIRDWIAIPKRASITPFAEDMPLAGSYKTQLLMCDNPVSSVLPATDSSSYDYALTEMIRACDILVMDVRIQEEYLNLHADVSCWNLCSSHPCISFTR